MKARLQVTRDGAVLHSGVYEIDGADDFGKACARVWSALRERHLLAGAQITVAAVR